MMGTINTPRGFSQGLCSNMATDMTDLNEEVHSVFVVYDPLFSAFLKTNAEIYYSFLVWKKPKLPRRYNSSSGRRFGSQRERWRQTGQEDF